MQLNEVFFIILLLLSLPLTKASRISQTYHHEKDREEQYVKQYNDLYKRSTSGKRKMNVSGPSGVTVQKGGRFIVKYKDGSKELIDKIKNATEGEAGSIASSNTSGRRLTEDEIYRSLLLRDNAEVVTLDSDEELLEWKKKKSVEYIEEDTKVYLQQIEGDDVPYGIDLVKALQIPDDDVANRKVCIIDSGYDASHEDLPSADTGSTITGTEDGAGPWDSDGNGHGTHVAGTIAAVANGKGVVGVNRNGEVKLHIVRVFNDEARWTWSSTLIAAVEACVDAEANIVNMSLGGGGSSEIGRMAYKRVYEEDNVLLIAAAGNDGNTKYSYPASYETVLSVAAIDSNKDITSFSQKNDQVNIAAPGVSVRSTLPGNAYGTYSGTSMATPHVSGVAALIWSRFPDKSAKEIWDALTASAEDLGPAGRDDAYGHGLVRADRAVAFLNGDLTVIPTISPTSRPAIPCIDDPVGWYDSDGEDYNCVWYAFGKNCETYGDDYAGVESKTANEACCTCGGGFQLSPSAPPSMSPSGSPSLSPSDVPSTAPSASPSTAPSAVPSAPPSGLLSVSDPKKTSLSTSPTDNVSLSPSTSPSESLSTSPTDDISLRPSTSPSGSPSTSPTDGISLRPSTSPSGSPSTFPTDQASLNPSTSPSGLPSTSPTDEMSLVPSMSTPEPTGCIDNPVDWYDEDGPTYNCLWYANDNNCELYGDYFPGIKDKTAKEACCVCGGGSSYSSAPTPSSSPSPTSLCFDSPGNWHDVYGPSYNCLYYEENNECEIFGDSYPGVDGKTANEACCACGGGVSGDSFDSTPFSQPPTSSPISNSSCVDSPQNWYDSYGEPYNCDFYVNNYVCELWGDWFPGIGDKTANEACCGCGGGSG